MTIGSSNELMQEGIRDVREGRMADAYRVFKKVIERNPRNEFAWIWISVTSEDRAEKRAALEKALEINPDSFHAKEALKTLNAEEDRLTLPIQDPTSQPTTPMKVVTPQLTPTTPIESPATPAPVPTPPFTPRPIGQAENTSNPARFGKGETSSNPAGFGSGEGVSGPPRIGSNIRTNSRPNRLQSEDVVSNPFYEMPPELTNRVAADKTYADTRPYRTNPASLGTREAVTSPKVQDVSTPVNLVNTANSSAKKNETVAQADKSANTREKRERLFFRRIRLTALFILAIVVALLAAFFVFNLLQKQSNQAQPTQTPQAGFAADTAASNQNTTVQPTITVPPLTTTAPTTNASATTPQASVSVSPTLSAASQTQAAITRNLQAAATSQTDGDYQGAITAYQAVIQADAANVPANLGLGILYISAPATALPSSPDRYASAVKAFQVVTEQNPNWAGGFSHLGEALALQGNVKDAIKAYSHSLELDPNGPERWLALAALYDKDNQPDQAKFCRDRANGLTGATAAPTTASAATTPPTTKKP